VKSILIKHEYMYACVLKLNKQLYAPVYGYMLNIYSAKITRTDVLFFNHFAIMI